MRCSATSASWNAWETRFWRVRKNEAGEQVLPATDAAAYDPETGLIFASTREGMIRVFRQDSPDKYSEAETVKTEYGAKTMGLDTKTHNLFVDTVDFAPPAAPTADHPNPGRTPIPGTFHVLVYGR